VPKNELLDSFSIGTVNECPLVTANIRYYSNSIQSFTDKLYFRNINPVELISALKSITSNAIGEDQMSIKMLKPLSMYILPVLLHIFNYSILTSVFPNLWKFALVKPIPKVNKPTTASHYRPISILPAISKIFEKLIYDQIMDFVQKHTIIDTFQSGFRKLHSTGTALLRITEDIRLSLGKREVTIMVLFDFSKAFDSVIHEVLLCKLRYLNFSESAIKWVASYLCNRSFCVYDSNEKSNWKTLTCGVPQGSVLGPLLYTLYTFDIGNCFSKCSYHIYADDLQIYLSCKPDQINEAIEQINKEITQLVNWTLKHGLKLNSLKTQSIIIHKRGSIDVSNVPKICVNGVLIEYQKKVKNLGVFIDENLDWNSHVSYICQRVYFALHRLYKFRTHTPISTRIKLVNSLILPLFDYCIFICCNMNVACIDRLQVSLNNSLRYIYDIKKYEHITPYYIKLGWLKIKERLDLQILLITHKILHGYGPHYLTSIFTVMHNVRSRATRAHELYLQAPLAGRGACENSFTVMGYRLWNKLDAGLCLIKLTPLFKQKIEKQLLSKYVNTK
jgi:hypothetical protein